MRTKSPAKGKASVDPVNGIDAVRNLIFGEQIAEYELRFSNLELSLSNKIDELDAKIKLYDKKMDKLDESITHINAQHTAVEGSKIDKSELADAFRMLAQIVNDHS